MQNSKNSATTLTPQQISALARLEIQRRKQARQLLVTKVNRLGKPPIPQAFEFLYQPARYKVVYGGRGKGASWSIARVLIDLAHTRKLLIVCTREVQNSIADSVHRLLSDQIRLLGYSEFFDVRANTIKSRVSDSEFIYRGLNDLTVDSIKSLEGADIVWCAEAHSMGAKSWRILPPTIRKPGSEIWVDFNPEDELAPTQQKFTVNPPRNAIIRHINYDQNPFFTAELEAERQESLARIENAPTDEAREQAQLDYNNVWLGATRKVSKASIFGNRFMVEAFDPLVDEGTWDGPYDGADWGFSNDPTVRIRLWIHTKLNGRKRLCIEREAYGHGVEIKDLPAMFDVFPDSRKVRIRGDCARPETISHMKGEGFNIIAADKWKGSVEDGVAHMGGAYDIIVCHPRCKYTAIELRLYSFKVDRLTGEVTTDILDANNHCMDASRYALDPLIQRKKGAHLFGKASGRPA